MRRRLGVTAFGMNAYTAGSPGRTSSRSTTEQTRGHEELYVVLPAVRRSR